MPGVPAGWQRMVSKAGGWEPDHDGYGIHVEAGGRLHARTQLGKDAFENTATAGPLQPKKWYHVAVVYDRKSNIQIYLDGEPTGNPLNIAGQSKLTMSNEKPLSVGREAHGGGTEYFIGIIDEVAIWGRILSDEEIKMIVEKSIKSYMAVESTGKMTTTWGKIKSEQ